MSQPQDHSDSSHVPHRVKHRSELAKVTDLSGTMTAKYNQIFLLTNERGDIEDDTSGTGLYFRDARFLEVCSLRLDEQRASPLLADDSGGMSCVFELTNPEMHLGDGTVIPKEHLSIKRTFTIDQTVRQEIVLRNVERQPLAFDMSLHSASNFTDMFAVRGDDPGKRGTLAPPRAEGDRLALVYDGADQHRRTTTLTFAPPPDLFHERTATWRVRLDPGATKTFTIDIAVDDTDQQVRRKAGDQARHTPATNARKHQQFDAELADSPAIVTSSQLYDRALARSLADLRMLAMADHGDIFVAAGVPWYVALFGRDSCIAAFETLAFQPRVAASTLRVLARYQGTKDDDYQNEEPGKILHELRVGEKANLREIPQLPYYGSVDATPWFLLLMGAYARWTGDLTLFTELRAHVERALAWCDANIAASASGFLEYGSKPGQMLANQGWKDSGNSIVNTDGSLADSPIALVEVQAYVYGAKRGIAAIVRALGETERADRLEAEAAQLKDRFNEAFWLPEEGYLALAIQRGNRPVKAIASNAGQALLTGIVDADKARAVARRIMSNDMFSGWGVRTLSSRETAYNPLDYQVGAVWPHDNALIALGLRQYGCTEEADRVFSGLFEATTRFAHFRLPEVFDGFGRDEYQLPVHYPVACSPQAWAAGALPLLTTALLGLEPDATRGVLRVVNPALPPWLYELTMRGLRVGQARVDLHWQQINSGTAVTVLGREGALNVQISYP